MSKIKLGQASLAADGLAYTIDQLVHIGHMKDTHQPLVDEKVKYLEDKIERLADAFGYKIEKVAE